VIGNVTVTDPDGGDSHTFTVDDARFEVVAGQLKLKAGQSLDFEGEPLVTVSVTATDTGGLSVAQAFDIAVTNVNEAPTALALDNATVAENAAGAVIGNVTVTDPDAGDSHGFTVDDARFEVAAGQLKLKAGETLDFEGEPLITVNVTATDQGNLSVAQAFDIAVTDVNEAPTALALDNATVAENAAGAVIGNVTVSDPDAGDTHGFSVDDARFEVAAGQLKLKAGETLDFESTPSVTVTVTATDTGGLSVAQAFDITVTDVNEAPTAIALDNATVAENAAGAVIGNVTVSDPDTGDSHTFAVDDARFEVVAGQLQLKAGESLNFEGEPLVTVSVTATDTGNLSVAQAFDIAITDVNEAPTSISLDNATMAENVAGAIIGDVTVTDPDAGDSHTFAVDDARFEVTAGELRLKAGQSLDFATEPLVTVNVTATDQGGLPLIQAFDITVTATDEGVPVNVIFGTSGDDTITGSAGDNIIFASLGDDTVNGGGASDRIYGGSGNDTIDGGDDNDFLYSGSGVDTLTGGAGNDVLKGNGDTTASYRSSTADVTVNLSGQDGGGTGTALDGLGGIDTLHGIRSVRGSDHNDTITGDSGANTLIGGKGSDTLDGGAGADTLIFEDASDGLFIATNRLRGPGEVGDRLENFQSGTDTLSLDGSAFDLGAAGTLGSGDDRFVVIGTTYDGTLAPGTSARYDSGAGTLIYSTADNTLYHDANGQGAGYTVLATVQSGNAPVAGDIVVT